MLCTPQLMVIVEVYVVLLRLFGGGNAFQWENIRGFCGAADNEVFQLEIVFFGRRMEH